MAVLYCFDYCSFGVSFKSGSVSPPNLFFNIVLAIQSPLQYHMNLKVIFYFCKRKLLKTVESVDHLGKYCLHNSIKSFNPLVWSVFPLKSVQFSSVAQSSPTLCDPMKCSTPSLPVHHQLPEFTQTHVHWVGNAWLSI